MTKRTTFAACLALALMAACSAPAVAQQTNAEAAQVAADTPSWAKPFLGAWTLNADGEGGAVCGVKFVQGMSIGGAALELSPACQQNFAVEDVAGWTLRGKTLVFIDPVRHPVVTFEPGPEKDWSASLGNDNLILSRGGVGRPLSIRALLNNETFVLSGPNHAEPCGFYLKAKTARSGTIEQSGRCAAPWKGRGWARWTSAGAALTLRDRNGAAILVLNRADPTTFIAEYKPGPIYFGPGGIDGSCAITKDC